MEPRLVFQNNDYIAVFKPKGLPTAPLKGQDTSSLLSWAIEAFPQISGVKGKSLWEPGLLHRLDTPTSGLVLLALNQDSFDYLEHTQRLGRMEKTYRAETVYRIADETYPSLPKQLSKVLSSGFPARAFGIESHFRPYGIGRKSVRPCDAGAKNASEKSYQTIFHKESENTVLCEITNGFRHQIRSHLAWLGYPVLGDPLYSECEDTEPLQLECISISFPDPLSMDRKIEICSDEIVNKVVDGGNR